MTILLIPAAKILFFILIQQQLSIFVWQNQKLFIYLQPNRIIHNNN